MTTTTPTLTPVRLTAGRLPSWTTGIVLTLALLASATLFFTTGSPGLVRILLVGALIFTAVYSRHMFVWLSYSQTLAAVIAGCEAAWEFFGGVFAVLIPDNLKPVIAAADAVN